MKPATQDNYERKVMNKRASISLQEKELDGIIINNLNVYYLTGLGFKWNSLYQP